MHSRFFSTRKRHDELAQERLCELEVIHARHRIDQAGLASARIVKTVRQLWYRWVLPQVRLYRPEWDSFGTRTRLRELHPAVSLFVVPGNSDSKCNSKKRSHQSNPDPL